MAKLAWGLVFIGLAGTAQGDTCHPGELQMCLNDVATRPCGDISIPPGQTCTSVKAVMKANCYTKWNCPSGTSCMADSGGAAASVCCPAGQTNCGGQCRICPSGTTCQGGGCACTGGLTLCGASC